MSIKLSSNVALIIVDVQNDFFPNGTLPVKEGDLVVPYINSIIDNYVLKIATRDWHPKNHVSFASSHENAQIGDTVVVESRHQILWPDHCVQDTYGAEFSKDLQIQKIDFIIDKGSRVNIDSYSGFFDSCFQKTQLEGVLKEHHITTLHICGLATDYCVKFTTCDALYLKFETHLLTQGIRAVNLNKNDGQEAIQFMKDRGAIIV